MLLALVSFWAGPFSPQPTLENFVAEKAVVIRNATLDALAGKERATTSYKKQWTIDSVIDVIIPLLGGLAAIMAVISFAKQKPARVASGAAVLARKFHHRLRAVGHWPKQFVRLSNKP